MAQLPPGLEPPALAPQMENPTEELQGVKMKAGILSGAAMILLDQPQHGTGALKAILGLQTQLGTGLYGRSVSAFCVIFHMEATCSQFQSLLVMEGGYDLRLESVAWPDEKLDQDSLAELSNAIASMPCPSLAVVHGAANEQLGAALDRFDMVILVNSSWPTPLDAKREGSLLVVQDSTPRELMSKICSTIQDLQQNWKGARSPVTSQAPTASDAGHHDLPSLLPAPVHSTVAQGAPRAKRQLNAQRGSRAESLASQSGEGEAWSQWSAGWSHWGWGGASPPQAVEVPPSLTELWNQDASWVNWPQGQGGRWPKAPREAEPLPGGPRPRKESGRAGAVTTLMLSNLPCRLTREDLMETIESAGFKGLFDFLYLPRTGKSATSPNFAYGFINLVSSEVAELFTTQFGGYQFQHLASGKAMIVKPAAVQGLARNIRGCGRSSTQKRLGGLVGTASAMNSDWRNMEKLTTLRL